MTDVSVVKNLYAMICNGEVSDGERSARLVSEIEGIIGKPFRNTAEFHHLVADYIKREGLGKTTGELVRKKRRGMKWTQAELAAHLGVTERTIINYESNATPPTTKLLEWLNAGRTQEGVHMGKSETGGIVVQSPENGGISYGEK